MNNKIIKIFIIFMIYLLINAIIGKISVDAYDYEGMQQDTLTDTTYSENTLA